MIKKISLSLISLIFLLILLELLIRILPSTFIKYNLVHYTVSQKDVDFMNRTFRESGSYFYRPSSIPGLGYELVPGVRSMHATVNSYNLMGDEYPIKKAPNTYRILLLGDSIIQEGFFADELKRLLNDAYRRCSFEVWNAAVGGYQVNQYLAYLKYKGIHFDLDMVIVQLGLNDFYIKNIVYYLTKDGVIAYYNFANELSKTIPLNKWFFRHSYLYRFLISKAETLFVSFNINGSDANVKGGGRYHLRTIKDICQKYKVSLLCVVFPYLKPLSEYNDAESKSYRDIIEALRNLSIEYIDLHKYFPEEHRADLRFFKNDYVHFSPTGEEMVARSVFNYLVSNHIKNFK